VISLHTHTHTHTHTHIYIYTYNLVNLIFLPTTSGRPILFCRMNKINDYRLLQYGSLAQAIERSWLIDHISYLETSKHNQTIFFTSYEDRISWVGFSVLFRAKNLELSTSGVFLSMLPAPTGSNFI